SLLLTGRDFAVNERDAKARSHRQTASPGCALIVRDSRSSRQVRRTHRALVRRVAEQAARMESVYSDLARKRRRRKSIRMVNVLPRGSPPDRAKVLRWESYPTARRE